MRHERRGLGSNTVAELVGRGNFDRGFLGRRRGFFAIEANSAAKTAKAAPIVRRRSTRPALL
jgi:hypothetical protein